VDNVWELLLFPNVCLQHPVIRGVKYAAGLSSLVAFYHCPCLDEVDVPGLVMYLRLLLPLYGVSYLPEYLVVSPSIYSLG